ncbi:hypothetical protein BKA57DRAFT_504351 [Linnemannia elongata]|nr:hypothetical protein BKA57DRAFT_504351 [Linnemannia elongata]
MPPKPAPRPPAPKPVPAPKPPIIIPVPRPPPTRPPPIIIIPGPSRNPYPNPAQPAQPCNTYTYSQTDNPYACPTSAPTPLDGSQSASSSSRNTGAIVGGVIGGLLALVALIVAGFFVARWWRKQQEMKDAIAYYSVKPRSMEEGKSGEDPDGVGVAAAGSLGAGAGTGSAGGDVESEQVQDRSMPLPPTPSSPATTVGPFPEPRLSGSKECVDEKDEAGRALTASSPSTSRPVTPAGIPPTKPFMSQPLSSVSTLSVRTTTNNNDNTTTTNKNTNDSTSGPKEEWSPGSSAVPAIVVDIPSSSIASHP